jgi:hypothetical protein
MPFQIKPSVCKQFPLSELDEEGAEPGSGTTFVVFRQAAQGEEKQRGQLFADFRREYVEAGGVVIQQHLSFDEISEQEVFLTMAECNILDTDGTALFHFNENKRLVSLVDFQKSWAKLPPHVAKLIHQKVLEMNPQWSEAGDKSNAGESGSNKS